MKLDATTKSLEVVLDGAVTTNQLSIIASYTDVTTATGASTGSAGPTTQTNDTTAVEAVSAPAADTTRQVQYLSVYNADTVDAVVTLQVNDNSTLRLVGSWTLEPGDTLAYTQSGGLVVLDSTGSIKRVNANSQPLNANLTDIAGLTPSDGNVIIGDGTDFITESGATLRTSIGVPTGTSGAVLGFLNGNNTHSGSNDFSNGITLSGGADVLDAYEKGTWTPVFSFTTAGDLSVGSETKEGRYVKTGKQVFLQWSYTFTPTFSTSSGVARITGLPFSVNNATEGNTIGRNMIRNNSAITYPAGYSVIMVVAQNNTSQLLIQFIGSGENAANSTPSEFSSGSSTELHSSVTYEASS